MHHVPIRNLLGSVARHPLNSLLEPRLARPGACGLKRSPYALTHNHPVAGQAVCDIRDASDMVLMQMGEHDRVKVHDVLACQRRHHLARRSCVDQHRRGAVLDKDRISLPHIEHHDARGRPGRPAKRQQGEDKRAGPDTAAACRGVRIGPPQQQEHKDAQRDDCEHGGVGLQRDRCVRNPRKQAQGRDRERTHHLTDENQQPLDVRRIESHCRERPQGDDHSEGKREDDVGERCHERDLGKDRDGERYRHGLGHKRGSQLPLEVRQTVADTPTQARPRKTGEHDARCQGIQQIGDIRRRGADADHRCDRELKAQLAGSPGIQERKGEGHQAYRGQRVRPAPRQLGRRRDRRHEPGSHGADGHAAAQHEEPRETECEADPHSRPHLQPEGDQGDQRGDYGDVAAGHGDQVRHAARGEKVAQARGVHIAAIAADAARQQASTVARGRVEALEGAFPEPHRKTTETRCVAHRLHPDNSYRAPHALPQARPPPLVVGILGVVSHNTQHGPVTDRLGKRHPDITAREALGVDPRPAPPAVRRLRCVCQDLEVPGGYGATLCGSCEGGTPAEK